MKKYDNKVIYSPNPFAHTAFPLLVLNVKNTDCFPPNLGFRVVHWHRELQFIYVLKGSVNIRIYDRQIQVSENQALFINKEVLHQTTEKHDCCYRSFIFPEQLLGFFSGSYMEQYDVLTITENKSFHSYFFDHENEIHQKALDSLRQLTHLFEEREQVRHFEYRASLLLVSLWLSFISVLEFPTAGELKSDMRKKERIRALVTFIHGNYDQPLTLDQIAAAANVSKSECSRCFRKYLQCSPVEYLMQYRIDQSMKLLADDRLSVTEIAGRSGFDSISYYSRTFRNLVGLTPSQYRSKYQLGSME